VHEAVVGFATVAADPFAVQLGDPHRLAPGVSALSKLGDDPSSLTVVQRRSSVSIAPACSNITLASARPNADPARSGRSRPSSRV
jgi:hypothetical protein